MLNISELSKSYADRKILNNVSFSVKYGEKIGLIGANGAGKSTILKIIASLTEPDSGSVVLMPGYSVSYLAQEIENKTDSTLTDELNTVFEKADTVENELREVEKLMEHAVSDELDILMKRYARLIEIFESFDPDIRESKILTVLFGLGFTKNDLNKKVSHFSGGWQMRIALAKILLNYPALLLLDEPTNHLDMKSLEWLEDFLKEHKGSLLAVSHDRFFLDRLCEKIIEIDNCKLKIYNGNYSFYKNEKNKDLELEIRKFENQQKYLERNQQYIDRFRYKATKAKSVQSRIRMLDKVELIEEPIKTSKKIKFKFKLDIESKREVINFKNLVKKYPDKEIKFNGEILIQRGEKIAIAGPNGIGKSTLLKILGRLEKPDSGRLITDNDSIAGYFSQMQSETLNTENSPLEEILDQTNKTISSEEIRRRLGCFQISGDLALKKIRYLSGGEKSRIAIALLTLLNSNILLLDEPTNHLDISSRDVLAEAIHNYKGTVILISHDRYFLDQTISKIIQIDGENVKVYSGNYSDYAQQKKKEELSSADTSVIKVKKQINRKKIETAVINFDKLIKDTESEIDKKENQIAELEEYMSSNEFYENINHHKASFDKYLVLKKELNSLMDKWEELLNKKSSDF